MAQWRVTWLIEHSTSHQLLWFIDSFVLRIPPLRQAPKRCNQLDFKMKIFETKRLIIRNLVETDSDDYYDMMGNPNVMNMIPREVMSREESDKHLNSFIGKDQTLTDLKVWGIETKTENEFIGLCAFLKNNENEDEIGYRLREKHWRKGFGTEIAKGLIEFGFKELEMEKITADVDIKNLNSAKILEKFMVQTKEFFNESDNCIDRRYEVIKNNWLQLSRRLRQLS